MRFKVPFLVVLLISFFSCEKAEEKITEKPIVKDPVEETLEVDEKNPELTVSGFADIIETTTLISISIVDESAVETKVMRNGEEIATSSEKQFDVSINPYGIPVGATDFMVVSTDAMGNEVSETYSLEIKHLLMTYGKNDPGQTTFRNWLFFNSLDGSELAVLELIPGDTKIYTDELILDDTILYTFASYNESSFKTLILKTFKIELGKTKPRPIGNPTTPIINTVEVKLNNVPYYSYGPDYYASGYKYYVSSYSGNEQQTTFTIKHDAKPICIRPNRWSGSAPIFDGKKESYKHFFITPEAGNTTIEIDAEQLVPAENSIKLNIPQQDPGTLSVRRNGYMSLEELKEDRRINIYQKFSGNETVLADYIDLPLFSMFSHYYNELSYARNGIYYYVNGTDEDLDVNMPNWTASLQISNNSFELNAANLDADYYEVELMKQENRNQVTWRFNAFNEDDTARILPFLKIPEIITNDLEDVFFHSNNDLEVRSISVVDYANYNSYKEVVNWLVFGENPPNYSNNKKRSLFIPNSNYSGKSLKLVRPSNLIELHRNGPVENVAIKDSW